MYKKVNVSIGRTVKNISFLFYALAPLLFWDHNINVALILEIFSQKCLFLVTLTYEIYWLQQKTLFTKLGINSIWIYKTVNYVFQKTGCWKILCITIFLTFISYIFLKSHG